MRRRFGQLTLVLALTTASTARASACADCLLVRPVADAELEQIRAYLEPARIEVLVTRQRTSLREQMHWAAPIRPAHADRSRRLDRFRRTLVATVVRTKPTPAARAYAAALDASVDAHRELRQRLLTALMKHGLDSADPFFLNIADGPEYTARLLTLIDGAVRDIPAVIALIDDSGQADARRATHRRFAAVEALVRLGWLVDAIIAAEGLAPAAFVHAEFAAVMRTVLVRDAAEWNALLNTTASETVAARIARARLADFGRMLPGLRSHYAAVNDALNARRSELLLRLNDSIDAGTGAEVL